ncbi:MAG: NUDIX domain-containing protein [Firmicutes bacterium]|nr:NUDIX domain-containing protein [[Eubacterium] siraeum]MCM1488924.1 NUDIX domain-containing protein [Bacillota bacterium]
MKVKFYENVEDSLIKFSVIVSQYENNWVFCKHRDRNTYEVPGGHRELGETPLEAAERELKEETGALDYKITPVCVYSVSDEVNDKETFGMIYYAEIKSFENELHSEIESIRFFENVPSNQTYPLIQPMLIDEAVRRGFGSGKNKK